MVPVGGKGKRRGGRGEALSFNPPKSLRRESIEVDLSCPLFVLYGSCAARGGKGKEEGEQGWRRGKK